MSSTEQPPPPEKKSERRFQWFAFVIIPIIGIVLGGVCTYWFTQYGNRMRNLSYRVSLAPSFLKNPQWTGKDIKLTVDGKNVENISTTSVYFFNLTDQDYDDVRVSISLSYPDGKAVKLLDFPRFTPHETVQPITNGPTTTTAPTDSNTFEYMLKIVNRDQKYSIADFSFMVDGDDAPKAEVKVYKKGLGCEELALATTNTPNSSSLNATLAAAAALVIAFVMTAIAFRAKDQLKNLERLKDLERQNKIIERKTMTLQELVEKLRLEEMPPKNNV